MDDKVDPTENENITEVPVEETSDESQGFEPVVPEGMDPSAPAIPDPKDSQNPPPRRG